MLCMMNYLLSQYVGPMGLIQPQPTFEWVRLKAETGFLYCKVCRQNAGLGLRELWIRTGERECKFLLAEL
ncbi:hypothetical protein RIF29_39641 [Crotalaria pallida]|uniref:Uncharacterized protein n=1 Tax=Crotalaria pallida TaxID=3830 RepID=A0AAN9HPS9_CROPI